MITGTVYRAPRRNAHGDAIDQDGNVIRVGADGTEVGSIAGLIFGGESIRTASMRGEVASTEGLIGAPTAAAIQLQHGDVLVVDGIRYKISGPQQWSHPHSLTGSPRRFYWIEASAVVN